MVHKLNLLLLAGLSMVGSSCGGKESADREIVAGTYVHTYMADVVDPETGEVMGTRTVRDTIFIKASGEKYEVSNRKWFMNDYENDGWVTPVSEADKPMPTYLTEYDPATKKLIPSPASEKHVPLYLDDDNLYWGEQKALEYARVDE